MTMEMQMIVGHSRMYGGRERYYIPATGVFGKKGERKIVEVRVSDGHPVLVDEYAGTEIKRAMTGKPFLFRCQQIHAFDLDEGNATKILDLEIGGRSQIPKGLTTRDLSRYYITRGTSLDDMHPKQSAFFTIEFLKDSVWRCVLDGYASEVDGSVYEIAPPSVPCNRGLRDESVTMLEKPLRVTEIGYSWLVKIFGRRHCDRCWHFFEDHASWPWRVREEVVAIENIKAGEHADLIIEAPTKLIAAEIKLDRDLHVKVDPDHRLKLEEWRSAYRSSMLFGGGFAVRGTGTFTEEGGFDYRRDAVVPANREVMFRVLNGTLDRKHFRGKFTGYELHV